MRRTLPLIWATMAACATTPQPETTADQAPSIKKEQTPPPQTSPTQPINLDTLLAPVASGKPQPQVDMNQFYNDLALIAMYIRLHSPRIEPAGCSTKVNVETDQGMLSFFVPLRKVGFDNPISTRLGQTTTKMEAWNKVCATASFSYGIGTPNGENAYLIDPQTNIDNTLGGFPKKEGRHVWEFSQKKGPITKRTSPIRGYVTPQLARIVQKVAAGYMRR